MTAHIRSAFAAQASLTADDYLSERLHPALADPFYLHLSDLKIGLAQTIPETCNRVLDYGCGSSPYRSMFRSEHYHRADIHGTRDVEFVFGEDSRIEAADRDYDCVLSTQVLEHVEHIAEYLGECRRVLREDGTLILTTHGTFADHGCPYDFWRWTADGLRTVLARAGFKVTSLHKLTTGPRALLFLNQQLHETLLVNERSFAAGMVRLSRIVYTRVKRTTLNALADRQYPHCRLVPDGTRGHDLYIALIATAVRAD